MKTISIFPNSIITILFTFIIVTLYSCAGEYFTPGGTAVDGISYTFDNDTNEAAATGYIVKDGNLLTKICLPDKITSANLTYTVTAVGDMAFVGASACEIVEIGANVKTIGVRAFSGCTAIKVVRLGGIVAPALPENAFELEVYASATIIIPKGCDISSTAWSKFNNIVEL